MNDGARQAAHRSRQWLWYGVEGAVAAIALTWLVTGQVWCLIVWEAVAALYLGAGFIVVWRGSSERIGSARTARVFTALSWILPLLTSLVGGSAALSALGALTASSSQQGSAYVTLAMAASAGVILSWVLLHVGFAEIYQSLDESEDGVDRVDFRGSRPDAFLNYLYLAFTVGASFAVSDTSADSYRIRRVILIHCVVSFFYNALVVATAIQVVQQLATR